MRPARAHRRDRRVAARAHRLRAGRRFPPPRILAAGNLCHGFFGIVSGTFRAVFWSIRGVSGCSNRLSRRAAPNRPPPRARGRHLRRRSFSRRSEGAICTAASGQWRIDSFGFQSPVSVTRGKCTELDRLPVPQRLRQRRHHRRASCNFGDLQASAGCSNPDN